jgi:hypothetical protein
MIFGAMTLRFASSMAVGDDPVCRWLCGGIGLFWAIRWVIQFAYYSSSHWRGILSRTAIHVAFLGIYGSLSATYLAAAVAPWCGGRWI